MIDNKLHSYSQLNPSSLTLGGRLNESVRQQLHQLDTQRHHAPLLGGGPRTCPRADAAFRVQPPPLDLASSRLNKGGNQINSAGSRGGSVRMPPSVSSRRPLTWRAAG